MADAHIARLCMAARHDEAAFASLLSEIEPTLTFIARRIAPQLVDDAMQAARVKVWRNLSKIDQSRPQTARAALVKWGVNAIRDEVRKWLLWKPSVLMKTAEGNPILDYVAAGRPDDGLVLTPLMEQYRDAVAELGTTAGMHRRVADSTGRSIPSVSHQFHREAEALRAKYGCEEDGDADKRNRSLLAGIVQARRRRAADGRPR